MQRINKAIVPALCSLVFAFAHNASAATIVATTSATEWDSAPIQDTLDDLTLTLGGLPTNAVSDLSVTFKLRADLDNSPEFVSMSIDGFSFGLWLNDNLADDSITDFVNDSGGPFDNQSAVIFTGTATIPRSSFLPLLSDGSLSALFDFSIEVNDLADPALNGFESPEFAEFSISYSTQSVPEPASVAVFAIGLAGLGISRRKTKA